MNIEISENPSLASSGIQALSELTRRCVASESSPERAGLRSGLSPEFLRAVLSLQGTVLLTAQHEGCLVGFAIVHCGCAELPEAVRSFGATFNDLAQWAYAHLIVVDEAFRGEKYAIYRTFVERCSQYLAGRVSWFWSLVRVDNLGALRAHIKQGWIRTGIVKELIIEGRSYNSQYLIFGPLGDPFPEKKRAAFVHAMRDRAALRGLTCETLTPC